MDLNIVIAKITSLYNASKFSSTYQLISTIETFYGQKTEHALARPQNVVESIEGDTGAGWSYGQMSQSFDLVVVFENHDTPCHHDVLYWK